jgi:predicted transcriptional regulator
VDDSCASFSLEWRETWTGMERKRGVMATTTMRISLRAHDVLQELAETSGSSMQAVVEQVIEQYRRQLLLEATNAAYAALRGGTSGYANNN